MAKKRSPKSASQPKYHRILLKLSGEALTEEGEFGLNGRVLKQLAETIAAEANLGVQITIVVGAGNIWRYADNQEAPIERSTSDQMGMLAGVMNAIALQNAMEQAGVFCRVQSAITIPQVCEPYIRRRAIRHLEKGRVVVFAAGTGQPYFTHDTAAALRALEVGADVLLKGTKVDGVYDRDPVKDPKAKKFDKISYLDVLSKDLKVMDSAAISVCRENDLPIIVFNMFKSGGLRDVVAGKNVGTRVEA